MERDDDSMILYKNSYYSQNGKNLGFSYHTHKKRRHPWGTADDTKLAHRTSDDCAAEARQKGQIVVQAKNKYDMGCYWFPHLLNSIASHANADATL